MTSHADNEQDRQDSRVELLSEKQKAPGRFSWSSITLDTWILEGASLGFSIACLMSIYGILFAYNGKPRPEFPYNVSLNAIVSVLATACKSSLIFVVGAGLSQLKWVWFQNRRKLSSIQAFEDASRGPMGSISFLFRHQGQSIASLGATILILMLAFEPFVQQILSYPTERIRTATETPAAAAPQVQYYNIWLAGNTLTSAYYKGIWTKDFNIEPTCPSGDCTWPSYKSLGFCSQCSDVTSTATLNCAMPPSSHKAMQNATLNGTCEVVLPQGRPSGTRVEATIRNGTPDWIEWSMEAVWEVENFPVLDGSAYSGVENPLVVMAQSTLGFDNTRITNLSDPTEGIFIKKVTQCAFNFCVNEYNVHVTNGTAVLKKSSPDFGKTENLTGPEINGKSSLLCWAPSQIPNDAERHYDIVYQKDVVPLPVGPEFTYCDLEKYGNYVFTGYLLAGSTVNTCSRLKSGWEYGQQVGALDMIDQILALGLDVTGSRVADSMTKTLLQNLNITIPGSIYANQVMVRVQWAWIVLPTLLVILGNVFLVWTTCTSRKKIIWKSSVLAFLFHGLGDQRERDDCMTSSGMEKLAGAIHVQLHPSQDDARVMLREN
ncbi:hypothetical protein N7509_000433 [Penicillium cosmopolitanum]|uniref:DUF3176 domain containing protein n=1 Tax=Penicillium cosmopolitanum TaxID=1131564 RepID=A0A9X0BE21_9EURO|nr:uncharacterized protein N7509_000433 [Penicillium cosmopolitanum]KAJ5413806.1 hypothetical protein N7509_000433 [Penicillium cosmopolitanum]